MMKRGGPHAHHAVAINATLALAKLAAIELEMHASILPKGLGTVLPAVGGNLVLVPSLVETGADRNLVSSIVSMTRCDAVVVRPGRYTVWVDLVKRGPSVQWHAGCRIWMQDREDQPFFVYESGDGPAFTLNSARLQPLSAQPWMDWEDFGAGLMIASGCLRALMEAR